MIARRTRQAQQQDYRDAVAMLHARGLRADWIGYAYGLGRLVSRGWLHWSGEQLAIGDEVTGIEILCRPGSFRTP